MKFNIEEIVFQFLGELSPNFKYVNNENGLINKTFEIHNGTSKYILQRINTQIFKNPNAIISNINLVNKYLIQSNYTREILKPVISLSGNYLVTIDNEVWRLFNFFENTQTYNFCPNTELAFEAAKSFSEFYAQFFNKEIILEDPLPDFINFQKRINDFHVALNNTSQEKKDLAEKEIRFVIENINLPNKFIDLQNRNLLPNRVIHADCKISNVLFSKENKGVCIIDLDTLMSNTILYDFGDMIRSSTNLLTEDDITTDNNFSIEMYQAVKNGFLFHLKKKLLNIELENLHYAAKVVIYIQIIRFLTDFLNGNLYYQISYPQQNLHRTRNQMNLLNGITALD